MEELLALLKQAFELVSKFKDIPAKEQITGIVLMLIAVWKSSIFKPTWDKLGAFKYVVPPVLGVVLGFVYMDQVTWQNVWMSLQGGLLAIAFHKLSVAAQSIPMLGEQYKKVIALFEKLLRKPAEDAEKAGVKDPLAGV